MPPEIVMKYKYVGEYVDLWSLGVLFYRMTLKEFPFNAKKNEDLKKLIVNLDFKMPKDISRQLLEVLQSLIVLNPRKRLSAIQIMSLDYFK